MKASILNFFDGELVLALSQALMHSVWQGVLVFIAVFLIFKINKNESSQLRYRVALAGMFSLFILFVGTLSYYLDTLSSANVNFYFGDLIHKSTSYHILLTDVGAFDYNLYAFVPVLWMLGFSVLLFKTIGSHFYLRWLKSNAQVIQSSSLDEVKNKLVSKFGISANVQLLESKNVTSPFTIGFIKPLVLFPIGMINQLEIKDVESILAHEFAHILRKDYFINLLVSFVQICLYYHPVVWWLSKIVKTEREILCDEVAINHCQDPVAYAKLLVTLQEDHFNNSLAMSINNNNLFTNRIKKILNMKQQTSLMKDKTIILFLLIGIGLFAFRTQLQAWSEESILSEEPISFEMIDEEPVLASPFVEEKMIRDTTPNEIRTYHRSTSTDEGSFQVRIENGEVQELKVDGQIVPKEEYYKYEDRIGAIPAPPAPPRVGEDSRGRRHFNFNGDMEDLDSLLGGSMHMFKMNMEELREHMQDLNMDFDFDFGEFPGIPVPPSPPSPGAAPVPPTPPFPQSFGFSFGDIHEMMDSSFVFEFDGMDQDFGEAIEEAMRRAQEMSNDFEKQGDGSWLNEFRFDSDDDRSPYKTRRRGGSNLEQLLGQQLNRDGFLLPDVENKVQLTNKMLKINGDKMPDVVHNKYKQLFEKETGIPLNKDTKIQFNMLGQENGKRTYRAF